MQSVNAFNRNTQKLGYSYKMYWFLFINETDNIFYLLYIISLYF